MWSSDEHHHTATCIPDMANPGAKLGRAKLGSDWLPARPWTGGGVFRWKQLQSALKVRLTLAKGLT